MLAVSYAGREFICYYDVDDARQNGQRVVDIDLCQAGDYVESYQGYVLPVVRIVPFDDHPVLRDVVSFPFCSVRRFRDPNSDDPKAAYKKPYVYQWQLHQHRKDLEPWQKHVAELVAFGEHPSDAVIKACGKKRYGKPYMIAKKLFNNKMFVHYLVHKTVGMNDLRQKLEEKGIGIDRLAEEIDNALSQDVPTTVRLWALNTLKEVYTDEKKKAIGYTAIEAREIQDAQLAPGASVMDQMILTQGGKKEAVYASYATTDEKKALEEH